MPRPPILRDPCLAPCLALLYPRADSPPAKEAVKTLLATGTEKALLFLERHRLDQLWLRAVLAADLGDLLPENVSARLKQNRRRSAVAVIGREEAARHIHRTLTEANIPYVFFKGFQLGEELYGDAVLRPSADLDLLVAEEDGSQARQALADTGFEANPQSAAPDDYEVSLYGHQTPVDLHWHVLQPERSRLPLTPWILTSREERDGYFYPGSAATLVILLLNPAVTDYVSERLIQAFDLDVFLRSRPDLPWDLPLKVLRRSGLRTAAWMMLEHTRRLLDTPVPPEVMRALEPGALRRRWLRVWLDRDPALLYSRWPLLVRGGLGLFLQDRAGDALRYVRWFLTR